MASTKRKRRSVSDDEERTKEAICVRMDAALYDLICGDADKGERSPPAQVRLILKEHYDLSASKQ